MSQPLVNVTIDGRTVQVPKGINIVEAAKIAGIEIPVFCYHPKLDPVGVCRMCLVQIEKIPKPQAACTTPVNDGMVVTTNSQQVENLRKGALEFLLINHPLDCPVCDKGGECDLQDNTYQYGAGTSRLLDAKIKKDKAQELGNFIVLDNERCILCRRCVRFDNEIATEGNLIIEERAHFNTVTTMEGERYDSYFSGNTIELCPVGALTSDVYRFKARPWDLAKVDSICTGCSVGCNVKQEFRHGELLRLTSRENPEIDGSWLCDRGRFNYKFVHSTERITQPMVKKDGQFVTVTWAEAMATIAEKFKAIKGQAGGKSFGVIGGGKLTNEEAYLLQKFARVVLGTNNVDHRVADQIVASLGGYAGKQTDLSDAGAILVLDTNPAETAPVMDLRIRKMADRKKAKIATLGTVAPKYRGKHARIQLKPGQVATVVSALAAQVAGRPAAQSIVDPETINQLAALLTNVTKVAIIWGGENANVGRALLELAAALKKPGSQQEPGRSVSVLIPGAQNNSRGAEAMGVLPNFMPGYAPVVEARTRETFTAAWNARSLSAEPGLTTGEMLKAAAEGQIQALYLAGANLVNTFADRNLAEAALKNSFVVVADLFLNETAALADVILPVATISEKSGTYTTIDGIIQPVKVAKKAAGEAQPDGDILVGLATAMGARLANSPQETALEIAKFAGAKGNVLPGAPAALLPAAGPEAELPEGLVLVPVTRLYAGGSTARFDTEFNRALPAPTLFVNPADAAKHGLTNGDTVLVTANGSSIQLTVAKDKGVVPGTVQAIRGLAAAPVNLLTTGGAPVAVTLAKLAVEVAD